MNHDLLSDLFRAAHDYHAAVAQYAAAMRGHGDLETAVQTIVGTSVRYRIALDKLVGSDDYEALRIVAGAGRIDRLRKLLESASHRYNYVHKRRPLETAELGVPPPADDRQGT